MGRRIVLTLAVAAAVAGLLFAARNPDTPPSACAETTNAEAGAVNVVQQLRSADDGYEIDLWTSEPFVVRAMAAILRVGSVETALSNFEDGSLDTLTFYLSAEDFSRTTTGDPMVVHYGLVPQELERNPDLALAADIANRENVWTFGALDKSQLNCPPLPAPATG